MRSPQAHVGEETIVRRCRVASEQQVYSLPVLPRRVGSLPVPEATMDSFRSPEDMLAKATQLWTLLDDMAENSPANYQQFMRQQLKEAKEYYAPPEPHLCLRTHTLAPTEKTLFVNICSWNKVPAPCSRSEPVPLMAGKIQEVPNNSELYSILDIAFNPSVLKRRNDGPEGKDQVIHLALRCIEERFNVTLSPSYTVEKCQVKGSLERMRQSLREEQPPLVLSQKHAKKEATPGRLGNMAAKESSSSSLPLLMKGTQPAPRRLIEEVSSAQSPEDYCTPPAYEMATRKDANGKPLRIELKVMLPELRCLSECSLSISKDDLLLEGLPHGRLQLDLPEAVHEAEAVATFYRKKGVLHITLPVCEQE